MQLQRRDAPRPVTSLLERTKHNRAYAMYVFVPTVQL